jgi:hypothetical protein
MGSGRFSLAETQVAVPTTGTMMARATTVRCPMVSVLLGG